ncbi:MAG: tetratricopeptide repeat protein [Candidatus Krumholzibacteriota bacterium]|nr:tetratricopeptide repeat protein [Candidatus Krumholzibacteriota bacterium]
MKRLIVLAMALVLVAAVTVAAEEESTYRIYLKNRNTDTFLKAFEDYEAQRADTVDYNATVILAYLHLLEMERNLDMLTANLDSLPNKGKFSCANILLELGRYDEAIEIYKILNEKTPKWSCPWRHLGEAYWRLGQLDDAVMALEKAIETRETHYDAYVMLADVLRDRGDFARALETLEKGFTYYGKDIEDPDEEVDNLDVHFLYLDLLEKNGMTERAAKERALIEKMAPGDERL